MAGRHSVFEGLIAKRSAVVVFNLLMLGYFWVTNRLHSDVESGNRYYRGFYLDERRYLDI